MSSWKVILATLAIFGAGVFTGALVVRQAAPPRELPAPPPWVFQGPDFVQQRFLDRMTRELALSPAQVRRLEVVFAESRERVKNWWEIVGPEMRDELREARSKTMAELNPEQRTKFDKLLRERRHRENAPAAGEKRPREKRNAAGGAPPGSNASPPTLKPPGPAPEAAPAR